MLLLIDNYDSFTFNLLQYLAEVGETDVVIKRNDCITLEQISSLSPSHIVISPGPCTPNEAGISLQLIEKFHGNLPILGVCLGHQAIGQVFGARVLRAALPVHGKTSNIQHSSQGIFSGLPNPLRVTRYHSLIVERDSLPSCLEVQAWTTEGEIMALQHRQSRNCWGVQFHPESLMTEGGREMLKNFLSLN